MSAVAIAPSVVDATEIAPVEPAGLETVPWCLDCRSRRAAFFIAGEDDLTGTPGRFTFVRCLDCGLVYQSPRLNLERIKRYYETDYIAHQPTARWGALAPSFAAP